VPKARLRYAIAIDANEYTQGSADPVVYVFGSKGGAARPFHVRRGWTGPQGSYKEQFRIVDAQSRATRYRSSVRVIDLTGEHYTDDFEMLVTDARLDVGEYELVLTINGEIVPGVPVFVAPGPGAIGGPPAVVPSIIEEATKKSDLVWLKVEGLVGQEHRPVWHLWHEGAVFLVHDNSEQHVPGLRTAESAVVTVRSKDKGGRLVSWQASVDQVPPGTPVWDEVVPLLMGKRLNNRDGEAAADRWARECTVSRLMPTGELVDDPANPPSGSGSAPPAPTEAATTTQVPFTLHPRIRSWQKIAYGSRSKDAKPAEDTKST
jgi:hypothetical protein